MDSTFLDELRGALLVLELCFESGLQHPPAVHSRNQDAHGSEKQNRVRMHATLMGLGFHKRGFVQAGGDQNFDYP